MVSLRAALPVLGPGIWPCFGLCAALGLYLAPIPRAHADPLSLRHAGPEQGLVIEAGWPTVSAGWWLDPKLGVAVSWRLPAAAIEAGAGTRRQFALGEGPWNLDVYAAGGVLVPTVDPGVALSATPAAQLGRRGSGIVLDVGLALPLELALLPTRQLRVPVLLEAGTGGDLGPLEIGLRGRFGPVLTFPGETGFTLQGSLWGRFPGE